MLPLSVVFALRSYHPFSPMSSVFSTLTDPTSPKVGSAPVAGAGRAGPRGGAAPLPSAGECDASFVVPRGLSSSLTWAASMCRNRVRFAFCSFCQAHLPVIERRLHHHHPWSRRSLRCMAAGPAPVSVVAPAWPRTPWTPPPVRAGTAPPPTPHTCSAHYSAAPVAYLHGLPWGFAWIATASCGPSSCGSTTSAALWPRNARWQ
jgi:hypothetical protein